MICAGVNKKSGAKLVDSPQSLKVRCINDFLFDIANSDEAVNGIPVILCDTCPLPSSNNAINAAGRFSSELIFDQIYVRRGGNVFLPGKPPNLKFFQGSRRDAPKIFMPS